MRNEVVNSLLVYIAINFYPCVARFRVSVDVIDVKQRMLNETRM